MSPISPSSTITSGYCWIFDFKNWKTISPVMGGNFTDVCNSPIKTNHNILYKRSTAVQQRHLPKQPLCFLLLLQHRALWGAQSAHTTLQSSFMPLVTVTQLCLFALELHKWTNTACLHHYVTWQPNSGDIYSGWKGVSKQPQSPHQQSPLETAANLLWPASLGKMRMVLSKLADTNSFPVGE